MTASPLRTERFWLNAQILFLSTAPHKAHFLLHYRKIDSFRFEISSTSGTTSKRNTTSEPPCACGSRWWSSKFSGCRGEVRVLAAVHGGHDLVALSLMSTTQFRTRSSIASVSLGWTCLQRRRCRISWTN